jgi:hypothetical protein
MAAILDRGDQRVGIHQKALLALSRNPGRPLHLFRASRIWRFGLLRNSSAFKACYKVARSLITFHCSFRATRTALVSLKVRALLSPQPTRYFHHAPFSPGLSRSASISVAAKLQGPSYRAKSNGDSRGWRCGLRCGISRPPQRHIRGGENIPKFNIRRIKPPSCFKQMTAIEY